MNPDHSPNTEGAAHERTGGNRGVTTSARAPAPPHATPDATAADQFSASAPIPASFWEYVRSFGPGIVVALTWVGTGDMIGAAVAGGTYGYTLIWALGLSLVVRFLFVNALARYPIYNINQDSSIVKGFTRLHPAFAVLMLVAFVGYGHILGAYIFSGASDALYALTGHALTKFTWAAITALSVVVVCMRGGFGLLEKVFTAILFIMMGAFLVGVARTGVNLPELAQGLLYSTPAGQGALDSWLVVSGLLLATTGSILNFVYPAFLKEKGWLTPAHRRVQQYDLLFATVIVLLLGAAIWVLGAETLHDQGAPPVEEAAPIAGGLADAIGPLGSVIFWLGLLAAAWTSIAGATFALAKMSVEAVHLLRPQRGQRYAGQPTKDPVYLTVVLVACAAIVWSLPFAPDFVILTVALSALSAPFLIAMVAGLIVLLNRKSLMGSHVNNWWQNLVLLGILVIVGFAGYQGITEAIGALTG